MVHWAWIPAALIIGSVTGAFLLALLEARRQRREEQKKWWEER